MEKVKGFWQKHPDNCAEVQNARDIESYVHLRLFGTFIICLNRVSVCPTGKALVVQTFNFLSESPCVKRRASLHTAPRTINVTATIIDLVTDTGTRLDSVNMRLFVGYINHHVFFAKSRCTGKSQILRSSQLPHLIINFTIACIQRMHVGGI